MPWYQCKHCKRTFSILTMTVFERHKLQLGVINLPHMFVNEITPGLGLDYAPVHRFAMNIMKITHGKVSLEKLYATVEIDEIYVNNGEKGKKGLKDEKMRERSGDLWIR